MNESRKNFRVALSRTLNSFDMRNVPIKSPPAVDAKHVHIYLSQPYSRGSVTPLFNNEQFDFDNKNKVDEGGASSSRRLSAGSKVDSSSPSTQRRLSAVGSPPFVGNVMVKSMLQPTLSFNSKLGRGANTSPGGRYSLSKETSACRVCDYLFTSGVEAAFNANFLCKFSIEFLIDVTNMEPRDVPRHKKSDVPCVCARQTAHSRARMSISVDEECSQDLTPYFEDVNHFIDSARACGKSVLIYSFHGRNRNAVFVVQYIMKIKGLSCDRAVEFLKEKCSNIAISDNFYTSLRKWDLMLNLINASQAAAAAPKRSSPFVKKSAWL